MLSEKETGIWLKEVGKSGSILGLSSIQRLMEELSNIQEELKIIHVAGTNGKGSVCTMLNAVLMEAGYRVGKYTSPAVFESEECYQINGVNITGKEFAEIITEVKAGCDRMLEKGWEHPTVFEVETAAAFLYFYRSQCEVVILETGMGGALDATNIIRKPLVSVITSISRDHMAFLGNTLEEIAAVKAGIIKARGEAVVARPAEPLKKIFEEAGKRNQARIYYADMEKAEDVKMEKGRLCFSYGVWGKVTLGMAGVCQVENGICVLETINCLKRRGFSITREQVRRGLEQAHCEGRFSMVSADPLVIIDGAHNEDAAKKLRKTLEMGFTNRKIIYIIGVLADKEHEKMMQIMLPLAEKVFTVTPGNPRAFSGSLLAEEASRYHPDVEYVHEIKTALARALEAARQKNAMVLSFGSLSYLGEVKHALKERKEHDK